MKFPTKTIKLKPGNIAQPVNSFRKEFLEDMPQKLRNTVRGVDLALINDAISAIAEGHVKVNSKSPSARAERFVAIASYFKTARTSMNILLDTAMEIKENYSVAITYKDQPYTYKFPSNPSEN